MPRTTAQQRVELELAELRRRVDALALQAEKDHDAIVANHRRATEAAAAVAVVQAMRDALAAHFGLTICERLPAPVRDRSTAGTSTGWAPETTSS